MLSLTSNIKPRKSDFFHGNWPTFFDQSPGDLSYNDVTVPSINIRENTDNYVIEVAVPGMSREDFNVKVDNHLLIIEGVSNNEDPDDYKYSRREFSYRSFYRSFHLDEGSVVVDKISADYRDGILFVNIPKTEAVKKKKPRTIDIS